MLIALMDTCLLHRRCCSMNSSRTCNEVPVLACAANAEDVNVLARAYASRCVGFIMSRATSRARSIKTSRQDCKQRVCGARRCTHASSERLAASRKTDACLVAPGREG